MKKENLTQEQEKFCNELEQAISNCIYCVESAKCGISMDLAKDIKETYESFNRRWLNMVDNYYSNMPIAKLLIEFSCFAMYVGNIAEVVANTNKSIEKLYDMLEED
jgi:putative heme iron utilization protein